MISISLKIYVFLFCHMNPNHYLIRMSAISDPVIQVIQTIIDPLKIKALKKDVLETISPYYNDNELKLDYIIYKCNEEKIKVQLNLNDVYFIYFSNYIVIHCVTFIIIILIRIPIMAHFLFQPDVIDSVKFKPIKTDLHQGVRKIVDYEIFHVFNIINI